MKPLFIGYLLFLLPSFCGFAQNDSVKGFLFPDYREGVVTYKNGAKAKAQLNYNLATEEMRFISRQQNQEVIMILDNLPEVGSVIIDDRRFVPVNNAFYECVTAGKGDYYIQRKISKIQRAKNTGLGYSTSSASSDVGYYSPQAKELESTDLFEEKVENTFYLKDSKNNYKKFNSAKLLEKLFKGHEAEIDSYAKENSIDFTNQDAVTRIVKFAYDLN